MLLFINVHVSAFYSSIAKDRLYHFSLNSLERRSAQTICFEVTFFLHFGGHRSPDCRGVEGWDQYRRKAHKIG